MTIVRLPEQITLELKLKKTIVEDKTPYYVSFHVGFRDSQQAIIKFFGLDKYEGSMDSSDLFLRDIPFNGLLLSTEYMNSLFSQKRVNIDKMIIDSGAVKEIPVLFSKIDVRGYSSNEANEYEEYLRQHFDSIYTLNTKREYIGSRKTLFFS